MSISVALLLMCGSCSSTTSAEARGLRADARRPAEPIPRAPEPPASGAGDEVEAPPAPDASTLAAGRALVVPGAQGFLSTWRVLGSGAATDEDPSCQGDECPEPRVVSFDHFRLELRDVAERGAGAVTLGATLLVPRATSAFLLVGMRGVASVRLDGVELARAESPEKFRRDLVLARLDLPEGEHRLALRFEAPERGAWRGSVRFLSARHRAGTGNVAIALGALSEEVVRERLTASVRVDEHHELTDAGPVVRVRAHLPGGGFASPVTLQIGDEEATLAPTERLSSASQLFSASHAVTAPMPERGPLRLEARIGDRVVRLGASVASDRRALEAAAALREAVSAVPEASRAPVAWRADELLRVVREHDPDPAWRSWLSREATRITRDVARERDPFGRLRGYERMAFFSRLDGTPQMYELFVPPGYRPNDARRWPLLVTLHGYKGNAGDYFRNTFGLARNWEGGETLEAHGRHGVAPTSGPMFVIAPTGRGQSYYRHAGEVDIEEAMAAVERRFRIDQDRVYITGGSMGGTGAAYVPYRNPDRFAAAAALAGYHDQRVRTDTDHDALSDVERFLVAERSDVDWAENGLHLPMLLVRGTRDRPLEWTRTLVRRLDALGYRNEHREPELGHNVWTETYADGAIFRWMARHRRPAHPAHVRLRTGRDRTLESFWVRVEQREAPDRFAEVDATLEDGVVDATIAGARAVTFSPAPPLLEEGARLTVRIEDTVLSGPAPLTIERADDGWRVASRSYPLPGVRRGATSGPIRDVFHEPLTFVVGTQDEDHTLVNRMVAQHWAHPKGWIVDYPIVDDEDVTAEMISDTVLVLIGPPHSNSIHARFAARMPIQVTEDAVVLGARAHRGDQVGTVFVTQSPETQGPGSPGRAVLVIAGPHPLGTWRSIALPDILPDYVVFDERVAPARERWACGGTGCEYAAHGFFDLRGRLPPPD